MRTMLMVLVAAGSLAGCSDKNVESRAREAAEKIKESIPDVQVKALAQKLSAEQVKQTQEALQKVHEYLGEADGKLDEVTVNAIAAFQRTHDLEADGILTEKTQRLLQQAAAKSG